MSEEATILASAAPLTRDALVRSLADAGVREGMTLFVQSSLSSLGWVCGGAVTVIDALADAVGDDGTIVMPSMAADISEPRYWRHPAVPEEWWDTIRRAMPPFDPEKTPTRGLGAVAETFRSWPGVLRSTHPLCALAARGRLAADIIGEHRLSFGLGRDTPLERCVDAGGCALLIGTLRNTTLHLSEYRAACKKTVQQQGAPVIENGSRVWKQYEEYNDMSDMFPGILKDYVHQHPECEVRIGNARSFFFVQKHMVEYGARWLEDHLY